MANVKERHIVGPVKNRIRLYDYLIDVFLSLPSRKSIKKALKKGLVNVDGIRASSGLWVLSNMVIELIEGDQKAIKIYSIPIEVIYEDDHLAIVNKPAGLVSSGNQFRTLHNALPGFIKVSPLKDALNTPQLIHRLDSATSGLIVIAKTATCLMNLGKLFSSQKVEKKYRAIIRGEIKVEGKIESTIESKLARTDFKRIDCIESLSFGKISWVELMPITGRTHQLRIHMANNETAILGDRIYGNPEKDVKGKGLFLMAFHLSFVHPQTNEMLSFSIPPTRKFSQYWDRTKKQSAT